MSAYSWANRQMQQELHNQEKPISLLIAQNANMNRDTKRQKKPFNMEDFYIYQPLDQKNLPEERYGAAALWLVENEMYPGFALFCFPELRKNAGQNVPTLISYNHPSAVLLAPTASPEGVTGLLIAEKAVSNEIIKMRSPCGQEIRVRIPSILDEVAAEEDITLRYC